MRNVWIILFSIVVLAGVVLMAGVGGYYSNKLKINPVYKLTERIEAKARRVIGAPTATVALVDNLDTVFLRLRGKSYLMPDNDFRNGGGLTVWDDDILVMHQSGAVFYLDEAQGLIKSGISAPENGLAAYRRLPETEKYKNASLDADRVRFNDIEFIDAGGHRGFLVSYTYVDVENECYFSRVSWLAVPDTVSSIRDVKAGKEAWETVFDAPPCIEFNKTGDLIIAYMAGGRMAFKAPHTLYVGNGEYYLDGLSRPDVGIQSDDVYYGKTIEIDLRTRQARIYSKGHRNVQGVELDGQGRLWVTEHGMRGGDELNLIKDGGNYGWPEETLGTLYSGVPMPSESGPGRHDLYDAPVFAWLPSAAVSSLAYVSDFNEAWDGDMLVGSLKKRTLFRARMEGERLLFLEEIPIGQRIRDVMVAGPNRLALWLDTNELVVFGVEERVDPLTAITAALEQDLGPQLAGEVLHQLESCNECHSFEEEVHSVGPSLHNVFGRGIGSTAFSGYSSALLSKSGAWNSENLLSFVKDPDGFVEGTTMPSVGIGDDELARALVGALERLNTR